MLLELETDRCFVELLINEGREIDKKEETDYVC